MGETETEKYQRDRVRSCSLRCGLRRPSRARALEPGCRSVRSARSGSAGVAALAGGRNGGALGVRVTGICLQSGTNRSQGTSYGDVLGRALGLGTSFALDVSGKLQRQNPLCHYDVAFCFPRSEDVVLV